MKLNNWNLPAQLRAVGLDVRETTGWENRSHGEFPNNPTVIWHHDASPPGDSPGALQWMINNWNVASANMWIDRHGVVFMVGAGVSWHAGAVNDQKWANKNSIGIEMDLTVQEDQTPEQLAAVRLVTAVILRKSNRNAYDGMSFHKDICSPRGRKVDPYGLSLGPERDRLQAVIDSLGAGGQAPQPVPSSPGSSTTTPPQPVPSNAPPFPGFMKRGSKGDGVRQIQRQMNAAHIPNMPGFSKLSEDGDFGPATEKAIRQFQTYRTGSPDFLTSNGLVGVDTWRSLFRV